MTGIQNGVKVTRFKSCQVVAENIQKETSNQPPTHETPLSINVRHFGVGRELESTTLEIVPSQHALQMDPYIQAHVGLLGVSSLQSFGP